MKNRHAHNRVRLALFVASSALGGACVVTTYEGPGEPPRVLAAPPLLEAPRQTQATGTQDSSLEVVEADAPTAADGGQDQAREIAVSHIVVMYRGSMRAPPNITRSKEEALARANQALSRAKAGDDFGVLAAEYSDEPGAGARGGKLGRIRREQVVKPFSDAAFALDPGELSAIVETTFGFHLILRTE